MDKNNRLAALHSRSMRMHATLLLSLVILAVAVRSAAAQGCSGEDADWAAVAAAMRYSATGDAGCGSLVAALLLQPTSGADDAAAPPPPSDDIRASDDTARWSLVAAEARLDARQLLEHSDSPSSSSASPSDLTLLARRLQYVGDVVDACRLQVEDTAVRRRLQAAVDRVTSAVDRIKRRQVNRNRATKDKVFLNLHDRNEYETLAAWQRFENSINQYELYSDDESTAVDELLGDLQYGELKDVISKDNHGTVGTQFHLLYQYADEGMGLFKPKRFSEQFEISKDVEPYDVIERHAAEIAAFHLDRIIGFRRVPPVAMRVLNITSEMLQKNAADSMGFVHTSDVGNRCFPGECDVACDFINVICGDGDLLQGSMAAFLPLTFAEVLDSPWKRKCDDCKHREEENAVLRRRFDRNADYCEDVRRRAPFDSLRTLLHVVDTHIFDFLTGNPDRHHFHRFREFKDDGFFVLIDNGKGFGTWTYDDTSILSPLYQCCVVRLSTVERLLSLHAARPDRLSDRMRRSLVPAVADRRRRQPPPSVDHAAAAAVDTVGLLTEPQLAALDRRVGIVIAEIDLCLRTAAAFYTQTVIVDDGL